MAEMPTWKEHFPIAWVDDHFVTRREFTRSLVWVSAATFLANLALALLNQIRGHRGSPAPPQVRIAVAGELAVGQSTVFAYPEADDPCLVIRLDAEQYVAFGQKCTHLACPVLYRAATRQLHCPCHEGFFDAETGKVLAGPPSRPLSRIALEKRGEELWAVGQL